MLEYVGIHLVPPNHSQTAINRAFLTKKHAQPLLGIENIFIPLTQSNLTTNH